MEQGTSSTTSNSRSLNIEGKLCALSPEEVNVKARCCKMAGDLIALGKFLRDHSIENPLEHDLRKAAKAATEKKFYTLHRYLLAAASTQRMNTAASAKVSEDDPKNVPIEKLLFMES